MRIKFVDGLRAIAVLFVVLGHALGNIAIGAFHIPGATGVTIFFVISGFVISGVMSRSFESSTGFSISLFYKKRFLKIIPPLVPIFILSSIFAITIGSWSGLASQASSYYNWFRIFTNLAPGKVLPGTEVIWSLAVEEQFYALAGIYCLLIYRFKPLRVTLGPLVFTGVVAPLIIRIAFWLSCGELCTNRIYFGTDTRLDAIAVGIGLWGLQHKYTDALKGFFQRHTPSQCQSPSLVF